ncbi:hypothetical protein BH23GEM6_BH23GEM6_04460 [soil metagenome]
MSTTRRKYRSGPRPVKPGGMQHIGEILQKLVATDPALTWLDDVIGDFPSWERDEAPFTPEMEAAIAARGPDDTAA